MARRLGATQENIDALARADASAFEPAWGVAFEVADQMTKHGGHVEPDTYDRLRQHWSNPQVVEIVAVIGAFNYFNRIANALEIPPTR